MMTELLLIEDDPILGRGLSVNLELEGYQVSWARDLKSAHQIHENRNSQLIILDQNLPDGNGLSFLKNIRAAGNHTPVIILTAKTDEDSVVEGLESGANDYVRKPFGNKELLARISACLRKRDVKENNLQYEDLVIQVDKRRVMYGQSEIEINRREFEILCHLVQHVESVVTRASLLELLDKDGEIFDRTIDSHVSHLRTRFKQAGVIRIQISSVYGVGYRLEKVNP